MSALTSYLAVAAIVASSTAAVQQSNAAQASRKAEKKSSALQRASEAFRNAQAARQAVAQARIRSAQALAIGEAQGVSGSSSIATASSTIFGQTAGQIGAAQVQESAAFGISRNNEIASQQVSKYQNRAAVFSTISQAAGAAASSGMFNTPNYDYTGPVTGAGPGIAAPGSVGYAGAAPQARPFSSFSNLNYPWAQQPAPLKLGPIYGGRPVGKM